MYSHLNKAHPTVRGLGDWGSILGTVVSAVGADRAKSAAYKSAQADSAARVAEAKANVQAAQLALQAEALKASQPRGSVFTSTPVLLGGAAALSAVLFFLIKRRKRRGG